VNLPASIKACLDALASRLAAESGENLVEVRLFGSYVRDEARVDSDVDILILVNHLSLPDKDNILAIVADVSLEHDVPIGPVVWDRERLELHESSKTLFLHHIQTEGVILWNHP
jgi:predicted nucleotidyltransferase